MQNAQIVNAVQASKEPSLSLEAARSFKKLMESNLVTDNTDGAAGDIPDIMDLSNIFEWAGVSLGREETFRIFLAIKHLVADKKLKSARLFGKILGLEKDYIIVESERDDDGDDQGAQDDDQQQQERQDGAPVDVPAEMGTGANKYVYWVATEIGAGWTRLPDVLPKHIRGARGIRKLLTGNLNHKVQL